MEIVVYINLINYLEFFPSLTNVIRFQEVVSMLSPNEIKEHYELHFENDVEVNEAL